MNLKKSLFQIHGQMNLFCGGKFSDRVSSEKLLAVSAAGPPAAFFPEIDISGFFGHAHFETIFIPLHFHGAPPLDVPIAKACRRSHGEKLIFGTCSWKNGHAYFEKEHFSRYLGTFSKMAPQAKPLCPYKRYRNSVQNRGINVPRCLI